MQDQFISYTEREAREWKEEEKKNMKDARAARRN